MLKATLPDWRIFSDTPLDVWAGAREQNANAPRGGDKNNKRTQEPEVAEAIAQGNIVCKISADYVVHPTVFGQLASSWNAKIVKVIETKYNDVPLAALFAFSAAQADLVNELCADPFAIDDFGSYHAARVGARRV